MTANNPGSPAEIARMVKRLRLINNLSQQQLAQRAHVSLRSVQNLESGSDTQLSTFLRVTNALGREKSVRSALAAPAVMPMDLLRLGGERKRATRVVTSKAPARTGTKAQSRVAASEPRADSVPDGSPSF